MLKNLLGLSFMFSRVVGEGEEVIHVDDEPSLSNHISEGVQHELLKGGWRIGHAEEHGSWFIESVMSDEGCLSLVSLLDADIVVPPLYIKFGETLVSLSLSMRSEMRGRG